MTVWPNDGPARQGGNMALYGTVDRRTWGDKKFRRLSDGAKLLFLYFLTGPEVNSLPGITVTGKAQIAEALDWSSKQFADRFTELAKEKMAIADWEGRIVWLPNATRYRGPANPNVVKSWSDFWDNLPECALKDRVRDHISAYLSERGPAFLAAWDGFANGSGNRSGNGLPNGYPPGLGNQKQEQEQEQNPNQEQDQDHQEIPPQPPEGVIGEIPETLDTPEFRSAWSDWIEHRSQKRNKVTAKGAAGALRKLQKFDVQSAIAALEESIANGWSGVFPKQIKGARMPFQGLKNFAAKENRDDQSS